MQKKSFKKYFLVFVLLLSVAPLKSQGNLPYYDDRRIHFGFLLGTSIMDFGITPSNLPMDDGKIYLPQVSNITPGFCAGIITDLRLNRYFNLRFTPSIYFGERKLAYRVEGESEVHTENIFSIPMTFPFYVKYSAERVKNYRPYLIAGAGVYIDFGRDQEKNVLLKFFDNYFEIGVGCDIYFPFFKLAPELKFALGFNDILVPYEDRVQGFVDPRYTRSISKLTTRWLTLSFNFE